MKKLFPRLSAVPFFAMLFLPLVFGQTRYLSDAAPQSKEKKTKGDKKEPDGKDKKKPYWQKMVEFSKTERVSGRQNGVRLCTEIGIRKDKKGDVVLVNWLIDYNGPRQPLVILRPTLAPVGYQQCGVNFNLIDNEGYYQTVDIHFEPESMEEGAIRALAQMMVHPAKEEMMTVEKGKVGKGTIEIPLARIEARVRKELPGKFAKFPPDRMLAQLHFTPNIRLLNPNLDPWTGDVQTEMVPVPLGKFAKD